MGTTKTQRTAFAVIGYVDDTTAASLASGALREPIEVRVDPGTTDMIVRIDPTHVQDVRLGASSKGHTLVQLVLKDAARYETVIKPAAGQSELQLLRDPVLSHLTARAVLSVIMA